MTRLSLSYTMQDTGTAPPAVPTSKHVKRLRVKGRDGVTRTFVSTLTLDEYRALEHKQVVLHHQEQSVPGLVTGVELGEDNSADVARMREQLRGRMDDLTGQEQEALLLHFDGVTYRAMAVKLGVSKSKAHRLVRGAMRELRLLT